MKTRKNYETHCHFQVVYFVRILVSLMSSRDMKFADQMNNNLLVCERSSPQFVCFSDLRDLTKAVNRWSAIMLLIPVIFWRIFSDKQQGFFVKYRYKDVFLTIYSVLLFVGTKFLLPSSINHHDFRSPLENKLSINCAPSASGHSSICFPSNGSAI